MADCQIQDKWTYKPGTSSGAVTAIQGAEILAIPDANFRRYADSGGVYRIIGTNPYITTAQYSLGIRTTTDTNGQFSIYLPQSGSSRPTAPTPVWSIILPDGVIISGTVPAVSGPLTLDDLITTHSWTASSTVAVAPVTPGTLVRGVATFTAATSATITFSASFASTSYVIKLTPSVDSSTSNVPVVGYGSKTTTGFVIHTTGVFTGTCDYEAVL